MFLGADDHYRGWRQKINQLKMPNRKKINEKTSQQLCIPPKKTTILINVTMLRHKSINMQVYF